MDKIGTVVVDEREIDATESAEVGDIEKVRVGVMGGEIEREEAVGAVGRIMVGVRIVRAIDIAEGVEGGVVAREDGREREERGRAREMVRIVEGSGE